MEYLEGEPNGTTRTRLFRTRAEARKRIEEVYGYIRKRKDLREYPHGWLMPKVVRVAVEIKIL